MSGRCETCRHWDKWGNPIVGFCLLMESDKNKPVRPESRVFAMSESGEPAYLKTHRRFGCIQHEEKP